MTKQLTPEQAAILAAHPTAIAWHGGGKGPDAPCRAVFFRDGLTIKNLKTRSAGFDWSHRGNFNDIIAYIPDPDYPTPDSIMDLTDELRRLLLEAREYVADAIEAMDHSDGRDLLARIDDIQAFLPAPDKPRPTRHDARNMLAAAFDAMDFYAVQIHGIDREIQQGRLDFRQSVKAIIDAIAGEE